MTVEESFYFAILRISISQILKASGFDKCKPSILNIITDLYIKYFELLIRKTLKNSTLRTNSSNKIEIQDIVQSMKDVQLIKPSSFETYLDPFDRIPKIQTSRRIQHENYNTKSIESFMNWLNYSDAFYISKKLSQVPNSLIKNLIEKRKINDSTETDQERKRRKLKEKQDFYNQFKVDDFGGRLSGKMPASYPLNNQENDNLNNAVENDEVNDEITNDDKLSWLNYLAEKDLKLGNNFKFTNTLLKDDLLKLQKNKKLHPDNKDQKQNDDDLINLNKFDYMVLNVDDYIDEKTQEDIEHDELIKPSSTLVSNLPYNIKYDIALLDDSIDQYIEYQQKHGVKEQEDEAESSSTEQEGHEHIILQQNDHDSDDLIINDDGIGGDNNLMFL